MGTKALIVEDEEEIALILSIILKGEGLKTSVAHNLKKARLLKKNEDYDLFLLDLNLPDGTGFELMEEIRKSGKNASIIVLSAFDGHVEKKRAADFGVDTFIGKPFSKDEIVNAIADLKLK